LIVAVNLIVIAVTLLVGGFLVIWLAFPRLRPWFEAPKYRILEWERRYPAAVRNGATDYATSRTNQSRLQ
jgi:hypothetical protein